MNLNLKKFKSKTVSKRKNHSNKTTVIKKFNKIKLINEKRKRKIYLYRWILLLLTNKLINEFVYGNNFCYLKNALRLYAKDFSQSLSKTHHQHSKSKIPVFELYIGNSSVDFQRIQRTDFYCLNCSLSPVFYDQSIRTIQMVLWFRNQPKYIELKHFETWGRIPWDWIWSGECITLNIS